MSGGGGDVVGRGVVGGGVGWCVQQGPVQVGLFLRCFEVFSPEHYTWSHWWYFEHSIEIAESGLLLIGQNQGTSTKR